ncbi:MAG: type II/IV secretion system ATPase subunit [Lachnospiraceae bacterium]|nr:type II/IV secretion system ATPase subunit [Lachnospiraceae bacterium]
MSEYKIADAHFGPLLPFIQDDNITDTTWDGRMLWVDDINLGRYPVDVKLSKSFVDEFAQRVANHTEQAFNRNTPLLEARVGLLRISIIHEETAHTGTSICIRKTSDTCRLEKEDCISNGFCDEEVWNFLPKIIRSGFSCIAGGLPGVGKTEFLKLLSTYIPPHERAIVMEDSPEFHFAMINPKNDCTEWQISKVFDYEMALKASLRQRPEWNILAEARGRETQYLMENFSSGIKVLTSTHLEDEKDLIPRLENMIGDPLAASRIRNEIYLRGLVVFAIRRTITPMGIRRYIAQGAFYSQDEDGAPIKTLFIENGKIISKELPASIMRKFQAAGFEDPFDNSPMPDSGNNPFLEQIKNEN